jgi:hypothetical protein
MSTLLVREPKRTDNFWEHYTDIGHNDSKCNDTDKPLDWLWIWVDGRVIAQERAMGQTHSQLNLPNVPDHMLHFRGSYDVDKKIISIAKPWGTVSEFRDTPSTIIAALTRKFPEAICLIDFGT